MSFIQLISIFGTFSFLLIVFRLIIKKKLREEFSVIWIICSIILNIFAFWRESIEVLADFFGIYYPPSIVFILILTCIIFYCLHLSLILSKQREQIKNLTQEMAFIQNKLANSEKNK